MEDDQQSDEEESKDDQQTVAGKVTRSGAIGVRLQLAQTVKTNNNKNQNRK